MKTLPELYDDLAAENARLRAENEALKKDAERWRAFVELATTNDIETDEDWWTDKKIVSFEWTAYEWRDGKRYDVLPTLTMAIDAILAAREESK